MNRQPKHDFIRNFVIPHKFSLHSITVCVHIHKKLTLILSITDELVKKIHKKSKEINSCNHLIYKRL